MTDRAAQVRDNLHRVEARIAEAAAHAGRDPAEVTLVGVTKYVGADEARLLYDAGCRLLGESRPQQLWEKAASEAFADAGPVWHAIGHLQRNKVARTLPLAGLLHSGDSERLLREVSKHSTPDRPARVLLEVNVSGDAEKHGFTPDGAREFVSRLAHPEFANLRVCGLMTMAAREGGPAVARRNFADLRELRDELLPGAELSMGMSGDFEEAIAEGATIVRVGSRLWEGL